VIFQMTAHNAFERRISFKGKIRATWYHNVSARKR
jgi:hypothetical protein